MIPILVLKTEHKVIYNKSNLNCKTFFEEFIMSNVSLERYYFVLYDGALTLKMSKMALNAFCDKTLHMMEWGFSAFWNWALQILSLSQLL